MTNEQTITLDKEAVAYAISVKLKRANDLLQECVFLAEEAGIVFSLPWGGEGTHQRGMGADYIPTTASDRDISIYSNDGETTGWQSSSESC